MAAALKRLGCVLIDKGAKVQKLENLGIDKDLPYRFYVKDTHHYKGR